jgi:hypothetical protein
MSGIDTGRVKELQGALAERKTLIEGMAASWKSEGAGKFVLSPEEHAKYLGEVKAAQQIKELIEAEVAASGIFEWMEMPAGRTVGGDDAAAAQRGMSLRKSLGESFMGSDAVKSMREAQWQHGGSIQVEAGLPDLSRASEVKDIYSAMGGTVPNIPAIGTAQNLGWTPRQLRTGRVRELFPAEATQAAILYGVRETGFINRAAAVRQRTAADGVSAPTGGPTDLYGLKPRSDLTIAPVTYPIATIAHLMYVHKLTLDDEPRMRGLIDRDLIDGVKLAEDEAILYGNGVGENLTGIMNTPGVQTYTGLATDKRSAQIRRAITKAVLAYFQPTGIVMSPQDWEDIELETDNNGQYTVATSVAVGGEKRVWRLTITDTPAMAEGQFLLGAFGTGAKLYDREQVNVQLSTENRDFFERNVYTLRAEERLALVVDRPESFVVGAFTTPA